MIKNKKAGERILSIYLFIIYIIVTIGIVSGVLLVYGSALDVREVEAGILNDKVIDCLVEQGVLKENVFEENFDLLDFCNLDFSENEYGVGIKLLDFDSLEELKEEMVFGRDDYLQYCELKGDKIPKCDEKEIYILMEEGIKDYSIGTVADPDSIVGETASDEVERVLLKVQAAVGKSEKNV